MFGISVADWAPAAEKDKHSAAATMDKIFALNLCSLK